MKIDVNLKMSRILSPADVKHGISLFSSKEIEAVEEMITEQDEKYTIKCQIRDKYIVAKPEEIVRQLWIYRLLTEYGYPKERIDVERVVYFGSQDSGLADIVVLQEDLIHPYIIFEVKRPQRTKGLEQLKSYCNAEGAPIGIWSNGNETIRLHREEPNIFVELPRVPRVTETLRDILTERWTIKWLEEHDELKQGKTTLKKIILDLEELVLGNSGVDPFEEIFKLIYAKLYDEWNGINNPSYQLEFFVGDRTQDQVRKSITNLLDGAKREWPGVFEITDKIELRDEHLKVCVSFLEKIKLFNSNLRIIDEAFEYLVPQVSKKKEGQFFTPRPVEDMIVKMLNPKANEFVIDPACGSAGFLLHSVMYIAGDVISGKPLPPIAQNFAQNKIYGIDISKKAVKIAKAINLIVGDGKSNIYKDNTLTPHAWRDATKLGLRDRLLRYPDDPSRDRENQEKYLYFDFDVLMTNPPFAGTVKKDDIRGVIRYYNLMDKNGKYLDKTGRHILFLERSLHLLKPGGRMAIVLPQGILNNSNTEYIRRFIIEEARILAVIGLHVNTFKPHTGTKTSVLLLRKYTDDEKAKIHQIKVKYEAEWDKYLETLIERFTDTDWDSNIDENQVPEELLSFLDTCFEGRENIDDLSIEEDDEIDDTENDNEEENKKKGKKPLNVLIQEKQSLEEALEEKSEKLQNEDSKDVAKFKKEIKTIQNKIKKLVKELSQRTLPGQIKLVMTEKKLTEQFKNFWLDEKVAKEFDYHIFFAVNQKALKDNRGEYRFIRDSSGEIQTDKDGYPVIDNDLDEIAEAFIRFAKEQLTKGDAAFDFWRD